MKSDTRAVAYTLVLAALSIALSPLTIPIEGAKISPWQSMANVLAAVLVGPWYGALAALVSAIGRNALGTGTLFAFPGGMIGAVLAGLLYRYTRSLLMAAAGEIVGTGILAALFSAIIWAPAALSLLGPNALRQPAGLTALVIPFLLAAVPGSILGVVGAKILERAGFVERAPEKGASARGS